MQISNYVDIRNKVFSVRETKRKSKNLSKKKKILQDYLVTMSYLNYKYYYQYFFLFKYRYFLLLSTEKA